MLIEEASGVSVLEDEDCPVIGAGVELDSRKEVDVISESAVNELAGELVGTPEEDDIVLMSCDLEVLSAS